MQLGSVNSFSTNQVPLTTKPKMPVSDTATSLQTTKVQASYSSETEYQRTESDADIGIYNPTNVAKGSESKISSMSVTDEQNSVVDQQFARKSKYAVTPNQATTLDTISVRGSDRPSTRDTGGDGDGSGFGRGNGNGNGYGRIGGAAPHNGSGRHFVGTINTDKVLRENGEQKGQDIFGRSMTNEEKVKFGEAANYSRMRGNSFQQAKLDGYLTLMQMPAARDYQDRLLRDSLLSHEKNKPTAYIDSLGHLTVGIGHKVVAGDNIKLGDTISQARIEQFYQNDSSKAMNAARQQAASIGITSSKMVAAIAGANYQLGSFKHDFTRSWAALASGNFNQAIAEIENSRWIVQTPDRANDLIAAIREYAPTHAR